ncbi:hypothetical protein [Jeotgalibacillus proteolyticus]|uniref:hypothetical protein n=1 Tax=Jeotgalibacillus proteolyticus TaxID=2082395 RepID=UPI003CFB172D
MALLAAILSAFGIWIYFRFNVKSMNLQNLLMAKGWEGVAQEESRSIRCSYCNNVIRRGHTTPYCTKCKKFM